MEQPMDRRRFLQNLAASTATLNLLSAVDETPARADVPHALLRGATSASDTTVDGHTLLATFNRQGETWKVYEDLRTRDGVITFLSSKGSARVLRKTGEATFPEDGPQY